MGEQLFIMYQWCNWKHTGLLIRELRVQVPSGTPCAPLAQMDRASDF